MACGIEGLRGEFVLRGRSKGDDGGGQASRHEGRCSSRYTGVAGAGYARRGKRTIHPI